MFSERRLCDVAPFANTLGVEGARSVVPGQPNKSLVWVRMNRPPDDGEGKHGRMPLLASYVVDQMAVDLVGNWISSLSTCP